MTSTLPFLAALLLVGCAAQIGSPRDPTGTVHEKYGETWQDGKMTACQMSRDAGVEFQGGSAQWRPCGRQFDTNVAAVQAFAGQAIGGQVQDQSYQAWGQGFNAAAQTLLPIACTVAAMAASPPLAALCGIAVPPHKPKPPVVPPVVHDGSCPDDDPSCLVTAPPSLRPGLYLGPAGHQRRLLVSPPGSARYVSEGGTEHLIGAAEWRRWVVQPLSLDAGPGKRPGEPA